MTASASEELDDLPSSVTIGQLIGGLADMALTLSGYTVVGYVHHSEMTGAVEIECRKCNGPIFEFGNMSALELLNDILEHHEASHRDGDKSNVVPDLFSTIGE